MAYLEVFDERDRTDGTARMQRLRQAPPQTGRFLALMAAAAPPGRWIEIGTSAGYSALWLSPACRLCGQRLTTFELMPEKIALARETFKLGGVEHLIELIEDDALALLAAYDDVAFCFLDVEKELYQACFELVAPRLAPGGLLLADNVISHQAELAPFVENALADESLDGLVVPIGTGVLLCRKRG